jgi:hypothetical protein
MRQPGASVGDLVAAPVYLAPDWVYLASSVTLGAVGSYPTFSPLPPSLRGRRFILCGTVRHDLRRAPTCGGNPAR